MNRSRVIILVLAAFAAGIAALLVRGLLGGGTPKVQAQAAPPPVATLGVLVASTNIQPGTALTPESVHWQDWPKGSVDSSFISESGNPDTAAVVKGTVARAPIVAGEPINDTKIVHADAASFMAARLTPGMRAVSTAISTETGAGGFILPNDRVDVVMSKHEKIQSGADNISTDFVSSQVVLSNIRVLAIDQAPKEKEGQNAVLGKTVTLELTPAEVQALAQARLSGTLSLALRSIAG